MGHEYSHVDLTQQLFIKEVAAIGKLPSESAALGVRTRSRARKRKPKPIHQFCAFLQIDTSSCH